MTVTTPSGVTATNAADKYTYSPNGDSPAVTSLSPANGMVAGGVSVTIAGSDFYGVSAVDFGATAATSSPSPTPRISPRWLPLTAPAPSM